jgi:LysM repeat protein
MTPSDELDFEMEGEGSTKPDTIRTKPGAKPPTKPGTKPTPGKPSTTGNGYPRNDNANQDPSPNRPTPDTPSAKPGYHLVVKNDTLYSLSRKYNTTVARLKKLNNMTDDNIKIGQQLKVQ